MRRMLSELEANFSDAAVQKLVAGGSLVAMALVSLAEKSV